jgi:hypothetical protein
MPRFAQSHLRALRIVVPIKSAVRGEVRCLPTAQLLPIIFNKDLERRHRRVPFQGQLMTRLRQQARVVKRRLHGALKKSRLLLM